MIWGDSLAYSPSICYEIIYPDFVRGARKKGARMLVNITNDGWFGRSNAPYQHANITRFRAIEAGIPIARCSNAGISVFYDARGRVEKATELFEETVLRHQLSLTTYDTVYQKIGGGMDAALLWFFLLGTGGLFAYTRKKKGIPLSENPASMPKKVNKSA